MIPANAQPFGTIQISRFNPIARKGLSQWILPGQELSSWGRGSYTTAARYAGVSGFGWNHTVANTIMTLPHHTSLNVDAGRAFTCFVFVDNPSGTTSTWRGMIGKETGNTNPFWSIGYNDTNNFVFVHKPAGSLVISSFGSPALTTAPRQSYGFTKSEAGFLAGYANGLRQGTTHTITDIAANNVSTVGIGVFDSTNTSERVHGQYMVVLFFRNELDPRDMLSLHNNPWQVFASPMELALLRRIAAAGNPFPTRRVHYMRF